MLSFHIINIVNTHQCWVFTLEILLTQITRLTPNPVWSVLANVDHATSPFLTKISAVPQLDLLQIKKHLLNREILSRIKEMIQINNFDKEANLRFLGLFVWLGFIYREVGRWGGWWSIMQLLLRSTFKKTGRFLGFLGDLGEPGITSIL